MTSDNGVILVLHGASGLPKELVKVFILSFMLLTFSSNYIVSLHDFLLPVYVYSMLTPLG